MTTIKIPFTKKNIKQIPASDLNAGSKGIELEIQTNVLVSQIHSLDNAVGGSITDGSFEKIAFIFKDDAEKAYYEALLDSNKQNFELSFDKDKVFWMVFGFGNFIDKTKPEVQLNLAYKSMVVFLESKFTGIITLESKGDEDNPNKDNPNKDNPNKDNPNKDNPNKDNPNKDNPNKDNPNKDNPNKDNPNKDNPSNVSVVRNYCKSHDIKNLTYDEENDKLIIEYKKDKPAEELTDLSGELAEIKAYLLKNGKLNGRKRSLSENDWEKEYQNTQAQKTNWTPYIVGGAFLVFLIVIVAIVGLTRKSDKA